MNRFGFVLCLATCLLSGSLLRSSSSGADQSRANEHTTSVGSASSLQDLRAADARIDSMIRNRELRKSLELLDTMPPAPIICETTSLGRLL